MYVYSLEFFHVRASGEFIQPGARVFDEGGTAIESVECSKKLDAAHSCGAGLGKVGTLIWLSLCFTNLTLVRLYPYICGVLP